jgi:succinylglutamic semialdehyde dehydrogenase
LDQVDEAVKSARSAFGGWFRLGFNERAHILRRFRDLLTQERSRLGEAISREVGKPKWEALSEVDAMAAKVEVSIKAFHDRLKPIRTETAGAEGVTRFKPHGVVSVFGPFNLPGHLPNGHIVPALLAGNSVVFKPSELAPLVGQLTMELWEKAGLPPGVINLVQGGARVGGRLSENQDLDGLFFTGSYETGSAIHQGHGGKPQKILALEMGGNNPALIFRAKDPVCAAALVAQSAFITSGQRCTCARRLIIPEGHEGDTYLEALLSLMPGIVYGFWDDEPEPFMGPLVSEKAADAVLSAHDDLLALGGVSLVRMERSSRSRALLSPGIIEMTEVTKRPDKEIFGPLLQVIRVPDFDSGIIEANNTSYGLAAGIFTDDPGMWDRFVTDLNAGIINWNRPLTGASSSMPFGGIKASGNHRPAAYFSADYCSYPCASLEQDSVKPYKALPGFPAYPG